MAHVDSHAPGSFCWIELSTPDQAASKKFYTSLFGWDFADFPIGPSGVYTMFKLEGRDAGAAFQIDEEMRKQGVPPYWLPYIAVASADASAAAAKSAGGTLLKDPFDVMFFGRMAVVQDPAGAVFAIWEAKSHKGLGIAGVPGTLCWADINTTNPDGAAKFYKAVFGWEFEPGKDNSGYLHIKNGETFIGGMPPAKNLPPNVPSHWMIYFIVTDCDAAAAKAKDLGAKFMMPPTSMEGVGRMAVAADPQGAVFALFQTARHS